MNQRFKLFPNNIFKLLIYTTLIYGLIVLPFDYTHFDISGDIGFVKIFLKWLLITLLSGVIIYFLIINKLIFAVVFPVFFIFSGALAYYTFQFNVEFNSGIIESTIYTNNSEAFGMISFQFAFYLISLGLISSYLVWRRFKIKENVEKEVVKISGIAVLIIIIISISFNSGTILNRIPFSFYGGIKDFFEKKDVFGKNNLGISENSYCRADSLTVVFVLGESMRADHVSMNGYTKETFPGMSHNGSISYDKIYSEWTYTIRSVPQILTRADSMDLTPSFSEKSFISIFDHNDYLTWWIGNQELSKALLPFAKECDSIFYKNGLNTKQNVKIIYDADMLPLIERAINGGASKKLIVIQQLGCHWWYPDNYPPEFEKYTPTLKGKTFSGKDKDKIINCYDNIALYTDYFLSRIVESLSDRNAVMIYLSDHGELLGENNKWLHSQNTEYEKNPACMIWFSDKFQSKYPEKVKYAKLNSTKRYRTDFLFHTILDAGEIESPYLNYSLSVFGD